MLVKVDIWVENLKPQTLPAFHCFSHKNEFSSIEIDELENLAELFSTSWSKCQEILAWWQSPKGKDSKEVIFSSAEDFLKYHLQSPALNDAEIEFLEEFFYTFENFDDTKQSYFVMAVYRGVAEDGERDFDRFFEIIEGECGFFNDENYLVIGKPLLRKWLAETNFTHLWSEIYEIAKEELYRINSTILD
jgi:hypothetical protein